MRAHVASLQECARHLGKAMGFYPVLVGKQTRKAMKPVYHRSFDPDRRIWYSQFAPSVMTPKPFSFRLEGPICPMSPKAPTT
jgi:hypothetical protein